VLLDYEDDALYAQHQGEAISIITPPQTILIQNPIAVSLKAANAPAAKAFVAYLLSPAGQKVWGQQGYRPVLSSVASQFKFPKPGTLFTIDSLGGWTKVNTVFFTPGTGVVAKIEQGLGVSTSSS
jgi:sulfate/thiosulfate transport system substrate-binding protein